jgi:hypothetical protein
MSSRLSDSEVRGLIRSRGLWYVPVQAQRPFIFPIPAEQWAQGQEVQPILAGNLIIFLVSGNTGGEMDEETYARDDSTNNPDFDYLGFFLTRMCSHSTMKRCGQDRLSE